MSILITGSRGFLGSYLMGSLSSGDLIGTSRYDLDLTNEVAVKKAIDLVKPTVILHAAALTNVDLCEKEPEVAKSNNVLASKYLAEALRGSDSQLIYISTDQIFDGKKRFYTEEDIPSPVNVYGKTKLEGEEVVARFAPNYQILRTNFYGLSSNRPTFLNWCLKTLKEQTPATLFEDVFYTPISITDLTRTVSSVINSKSSGIFNVTGNERLSKAEFFRKVALELELPTEIFSFQKYIKQPGSALRPLEMSLCNKKVKNTFNLEYESISSSLKNLCS